MAVVRKNKKTEPPKVRKGKALTREITGNLVAWFRFTKQFKCVATEVGWLWKSDVLALASDKLVEVEVKISASDLRNDKKKILKHHALSKQPVAQFRRHPLPTQFYYCVPKTLEKVARELIEELNPSYGLIVFDLKAEVTSSRLDLGKTVSKNLSIVKPAKALHNDMAYFDKVKEAMVARLSSALAIMRCSKEWLG